jgi:hypothetical protein
VNWRSRVRQALGDPSVAAGIAQIVAFYMKDHIDRSEGRGAGGQAVAYAPLKSLYGEFWTSKPVKGGTVVKTRQTASGRTEYLRDSGLLYGSLTATGKASGSSIKVTLRGPKYALYQDKGLTTKRTNYIPLTLAAKRGHGTGNDPGKEGFTEGRDYLLARRGVKVPARPFLLPTRQEMTAVGKSIYLGLRSILKRT